MMQSSISNSKSVSCMITLNRESESFSPNAGVYIGRTIKYKQPFFLDIESTVNPHTAIAGMTGSGKTYLLRSIVARSAIYLERNVVVIDWSGEYSETIEMHGGIVVNVDSEANAKDLRILKNALSAKRSKGAQICFNLSSIFDPAEKAGIARSILRRIAIEMPKRGISKNTKNIIVLDEAWKLLSYAEISALFREGRKYGFGIIIATQVAKDLVNEVISNCATIIAFKMQNESDFSYLEKSEVINSSDISTISSLQIGACLVIQKHKSSSYIAKTVIERASGIEIARNLAFKGDSMEFYVELKKFVDETNSFFEDPETRNRVLDFINQNEHAVDITGFISFLWRLGLDRAGVITFMRRLGFDDKAIVEAYSNASKLRIKA